MLGPSARLVLISVLTMPTVIPASGAFASRGWALRRRRSERQVSRSPLHWSAASEYVSEAGSERQMSRAVLWVFGGGLTVLQERSRLIMLRHRGCLQATPAGLDTKFSAM